MLSGKTQKGFMIQIPMTFGNYIVESVIDSGSTAVVFKAHREGTNNLVAMKVMNRKSFKTAESLQKTTRELQIVKSLSHPNIVKFHEIIQSGDLIVIVSEYCPETLFDIVTNGNFMCVDHILLIFRELASAIDYLHDREIAHGDIKLENILIDEEGHPKLIDFGYCQTSLFADDDQKAGTIIYAAPELFRSGQFHTLKADVWSLGIVLFVLIVHCFPYTSNSEIGLQQQILGGRLCYDEIDDDDLKDFVKQLTKQKPCDRPSIKQILDNSLLLRPLNVSQFMSSH
jgi:serine/threonine protein kinase